MAELTDLELEIQEEIDHRTYKYDLDMPEHEAMRIRESAYSKVVSEGYSIEDAVEFGIMNF